MQQDLLLDLLQSRARFEAELVGQRLSNSLVGGERVGLSPARYSAVINSTHRLS